MLNTRANLSEGYSECGYTKATNDTCVSFEKTFNCCTVSSQGCLSITEAQLLTLLYAHFRRFKTF